MWVWSLAIGYEGLLQLAQAEAAAETRQGHWDELRVTANQEIIKDGVGFPY